MFTSPLAPGPNNPGLQNPAVMVADWIMTAPVPSIDVDDGSVCCTKLEELVLPHVWSLKES